MHARAYAHMHGLNNNFFNDGDEPSRGTRFARWIVTGTMARARKFHHEQRPDVETPARFPSIENQTVELAKRRVTQASATIELKYFEQLSSIVRWLMLVIFMSSTIEDAFVQIRSIR